jgi:hypothetical protein
MYRISETSTFKPLQQLTTGSRVDSTPNNLTVN